MIKALCLQSYPPRPILISDPYLNLAAVCLDNAPHISLSPSIAKSLSTALFIQNTTDKSNAAEKQKQVMNSSSDSPEIWIPEQRSAGAQRVVNIVRWSQFGTKNTGLGLGKYYGFV